MDNKIKAEDQCSVWLKSEQSYDPGDIIDEPKKSTRIGDMYQAQIPDMVMKETIQNEANKFIGTVVNYGQPPPDPVLDDDAFLLGLYIFGKKLKLVQKFASSNEGMQDVLLYYYGNVYRNGKHNELKTSWMNTNKKKLPGMKIFTGWRLQELFCRIFPNVDDERKARLTRATRMFDDEQITSETYVFNVRNAAGINLLVKAIAIGKGEQDLTGKVTNVVRNKKPLKSFSSLSIDELINLLKYGFELSKEKLIELFWEAVWPRLSARKWKSIQLRNFDFNYSKNSLVFLAPGVKNFSPRGQKKGTHYFVSVTDVLNKVASEPQLLIELDQDMLVKQGEKQSSGVEKGVVQVMIVNSSSEDENHIIKKRKVRCVPDCEFTDEQGSSCEDQNQNAIRKSLAPKYIDQSSILNQDDGANIDQEFGINGECLGTRNCPLTSKTLESLASGSNNQNKRRRVAKERTASDILSENALAESEEQGCVISSVSEKSCI